MKAPGLDVTEKALVMFHDCSRCGFVGGLGGILASRALWSPFRYHKGSMV